MHVLSVCVTAWDKRNFVLYFSIMRANWVDLVQEERAGDLQKPRKWSSTTSFTSRPRYVEQLYAWFFGAGCDGQKHKLCWELCEPVNVEVKTHFVQGKRWLGRSRQWSKHDRENVFPPSTSLFVDTYSWACTFVYYQSSRRPHSNTLLRYIRWIRPGIT